MKKNFNYQCYYIDPILMNGQVNVGEVEEKLGVVAKENVEHKSS